MTTSDETLDLIESLRSRGESFCIATIVRTANSTSARAGAKAIITAGGDLHGFVGGGCVTGAVKRAAQECIDTGEAQMIRVKPADEVVDMLDGDGVPLHKSSCPSGGTVEIFMEPMRAPRTLLVCGASPIAQAVARFGKEVGYRVVVAAAAGDLDKIPGAASYRDGFDLDDLALTETDAAIVSTQGKHDREALRAVLGSGAGYQGMVCSRRKISKLSNDLLVKNAELKSALANLHAPAGLNIGAIEPEEIALSVIGEIVQYRRQREAEAALPPNTVTIQEG